MALPHLTMDEAKKLAAGPFGATLLRAVGNYAVPICWPKSIDERGGVHLTNGTAFFVKTPSAVFGVTAAHVVRGFLADRVRDPRTECALLDSETKLDLERDLISIGTDADIATFRVSDSVISRLNKEPITGWPPRMPHVGGGILYAGFPGMVRERRGEREFSFGLCSGGGLADAVEEREIVTSIDRPSLVDPLGHGLPAEDFDFGGMSGGPVLAVFETGVLSWCLAGVITRSVDLLGGILFAARADCVADDGAVQR